MRGGQFLGSIRELPASAAQLDHLPFDKRRQMSASVACLQEFRRGQLGPPGDIGAWG
jgi:hypothetical protein